MWQHPSPFTESAAARGLVSASTQNQALSSLAFLHRVAPTGQKDRPTDRRRADEAGPNVHMVQPLDQAEFMTLLAASLPPPDRFAWLELAS